MIFRMMGCILRLVLGRFDGLIGGRAGLRPGLSLVPMLCVGIQLGRFASRDVKRLEIRFHAENVVGDVTPTYRYTRFHLCPY